MDGRARRQAQMKFEKTWLRTSTLALAVALVLAACTQAPPIEEEPEEQLGTLIVAVSGLPNGVAGDVTVSGPNLNQTITASQTFADIAAGVYTVSAAEVSDGADVYGAKIAGSPANVTDGGTVTVSVEYVFLDPALVGALQVDITGLPPGTDASVTVTGPSFNQVLTASDTIDGLLPANYTVTADDVSAGGLTYSAEIDSSPALVLPEDTTTVTVTYRPFVPDDGDAASKPGVHALFRSTSGNPVSVSEMLFNKASPLDVKGIKLVNELGDPEDTGDWLAFGLVHGEAQTSSVSISLDCDTDFTPGSPIRVELHKAAGGKIGSNLSCGGSLNYGIPNEGGTGQYLLHVIANTSNPFYAAYTLSVDAFCFQGCAYQPYEP